MSHFSCERRIDIGWKDADSLSDSSVDLFICCWGICFFPEENVFLHAGPEDLSAYYIQA